MFIPFSFHFCRFSQCAVISGSGESAQVKPKVCDWCRLWRFSYLSRAGYSILPVLKRHTAAWPSPQMSPPAPDHRSSPPTCTGPSEANKRAKRSSSGGQQRCPRRLWHQNDDDDANLVKKRVREKCDAHVARHQTRCEYDWFTKLPHRCPSLYKQHNHWWTSHTHGNHMMEQSSRHERSHTHTHFLGFS